MKKRIFIPISIGFVLLNMLFWGLTILGISLFILFLNNKIVVIHKEESILILLVTLFLLFTSIRFLLGFKIHLRKEDIATFGDGLPKFEKIQYKCFVKYIDIKNINIVASEKNSKNKIINLKWISSSMPKKYLEFTLIDDEKERICINYYTKKQIIKMLKYINQNMQIAKNPNILNVEEIMQDWYSYDNYNREDLKIKRGEKIRKKNNTEKGKE